MSDMPMISENASEAVKAKVEDLPGLVHEFNNFMISETYCNTYIAELIDVLTRSLMEDYEISDDAEESPGITLDDALHIAERYAEFRSIVLHSFAAGLAFGRAKFDDQFSNIIKEVDELEYKNKFDELF